MLIRWNELNPLSRFGRESNRPYDAFDELRREMNRLFYDFENGSAFEDRSFPRVSFEDTGAAFELRFEVPGVKDKDLELSVQENSVTVKGQRADSVPEGYAVHRKERAAQRFARSFALPAKVDAERVEAVLRLGILTLTLPKAKEAQPRQINVRSA